MPGLAAPNRSVVRVDLVLRSFWDFFFQLHDLCMER